VELHDSEVLGWRTDGSDLRVTVDAYLHVSTGTPGVDRGTGWSQRFDLCLRHASIEQIPSESPLWITEGRVEVEDRVLTLLPVPFEAPTGRIRVVLRGAGGALIATADGAVLTPLAEPRFVEAFPGDS
jgi:hypothetical protein